MLYLIATPIGNLGDFSQRAIDTLSLSDLVLCEDTRRSRILLQHYGLDKPLLSFHQFNEKERESRILNDLKNGRVLSVLTDAGTPLISDPGLPLVQACIRENIPFTAIPGACSPILALTLSGFETNRFQFIGFLPREAGPLNKALLSILFYQGTTVAFESPQRLIATLSFLEILAPKREIAVARELTKKFEECRRGTPSTLLDHFRKHEPLGEIVLLVRQGEAPEVELDLVEMVELLKELHALSTKEAIQVAAKLKKLPKSEVYRAIHCPPS